VCVINETFAKRFFKNRSPIGLHVTQEYGEERHTYEVVGVVRDTRQNRLRGEIEHRFYTPVAQPAAGISGVSFIIRPAGEGTSLITSVRRLMQQMEPAMPVTRALSVTDAVDSRLVQDRLLARLSMGFGMVALLLSAIGLYGVLSFGVSRRTNEIGVRKALGAQHHALIGMIMRETGWLLLAGLVVGAALSAGSIRLIASRLYGLSAADPVAVVTAVAILAAVSLLATWLPARRAANVDPLVALRHE
jgi:predicted lysophospholipase L1 biosynthesis ABC-type transport system permease subunit